MDWGHSFHRLNLDYNLSIDQQIQSKSGIHPLPIVFDRQRYLTLDLEPFALKFMGQASFVGPLQKTRFQR